jgi:hypothetical protein
VATAYDQLKDCTIYLQGEFVGNVEQLDVREAQPTTHLPYGRSHQGHPDLKRPTSGSLHPAADTTRLALLASWDDSHLSITRLARRRVSGSVPPTL